MNEVEFVAILNRMCEMLTSEARASGFQSAKQFESRVREVASQLVAPFSIFVDQDPPAQSFPDVAIGDYGIEVKFTTNDTWRSVANSVLESNRVSSVKKVFLVFGKMGGVPEAKWADYERCVMHVRTSHVPRFEVEVDPMPERSLFDLMGTTYDQFRMSAMEDKMQHIRQYARSRLKPGERLWWLEDSPEDAEHTLPIQARLYTKLTADEKRMLRAEAVLMCPKIVGSGRSRDKYNDVVLYMLTYHGVLCHQARDLFTAGSVANPDNDDNGGRYVERSIALLESDIEAAAYRLPDSLFLEYWGEVVPAEDRVAKWLELADEAARGWTPSDSLFLAYQSTRTSNKSG